MSKALKNKSQKPTPSGSAPNSSQPKNQIEQTASNETLREKFMKKISGDPRFIPAKPSGKEFVIVGAKP